MHIADNTPMNDTEVAFLREQAYANVAYVGNARVTYYRVPTLEPVVRYRRRRSCTVTVDNSTFARLDVRGQVEHD